MATYKIKGQRYLRKYTEQGTSPVYMASVQAQKIVDTLCEVPWVRTGVDSAQMTYHTDEIVDNERKISGLDRNVEIRDQFDAALFCADHAGGQHRAYANAAVYHYVLPDGALPKLTRLVAKVTSDPYNSAGARIAILTNADGSIPTKCSECRTGDAHADGVAPRTVAENGNWFPTMADCIFSASPTEGEFALPSGGIKLQKHLFIFVLMESYSTVRGNWIEGCSFIRNLIEIETDDAVDGWEDGGTYDLSPVVPQVEFNVVRNGVLPSRTGTVSGVQICDVLGNGDDLVGNSIVHKGSTDFAFGATAVPLSVHGKVENVFLSNTKAYSVTYDGTTKNFTFGIIAVVGDFDDEMFGLKGVKVFSFSRNAENAVEVEVNNGAKTVPAEYVGRRAKIVKFGFPESLEFRSSNGSVWIVDGTVKVMLAFDGGFVSRGVACTVYIEEKSGCVSRISITDDISADDVCTDDIPYAADTSIFFFRRGNEIKLFSTDSRDWSPGSYGIFGNGYRSLWLGNSWGAIRTGSAGGGTPGILVDQGGVFKFHSLPNSRYGIVLPFIITSGSVSFVSSPLSFATDEAGVNLVRGIVKGSFDYTYGGKSFHTDRGVSFSFADARELTDAEAADIYLAKDDGTVLLSIVDNDARIRRKIENENVVQSVGVDRCIGLRAAYSRLYSSLMNPVLGSDLVGAAFAVRIENVSGDDFGKYEISVANISLASSVVLIPFSCPRQFAANKVRLDWKNWSGQATSGSKFLVWLKRDAYETGADEAVVKNPHIYLGDKRDVLGYNLIGVIDADGDDRSAVFDVDQLNCLNATIMLTAFVSMDRVNPGNSDDTILAGIGTLKDVNRIEGGWLPDITLIG